MIFRRRVAGDGGAKYRLEVRIHCDICLAHVDERWSWSTASGPVLALCAWCSETLAGHPAVMGDGRIGR